MDDVVARLRHLCIVVCIMTLVVAVIVAPFAGLIFLLDRYAPDERYSVAIDSASDLDYRTGLSFNLTLGVYSGSHAFKACIDPGTYVDVMYHCFQVAAWRAADDETSPACARPRNSAELSVVARATMMPVGDLLDSLAAEMGQGAAVFDLRLSVSYFGKNGCARRLYVCKGTRVGDAAVPCDRSWST